MKKIKKSKYYNKKIYITTPLSFNDIDAQHKYLYVGPAKTKPSGQSVSDNNIAIRLPTIAQKLYNDLPDEYSPITGFYLSDSEFEYFLGTGAIIFG